MALSFYKLRVAALTRQAKDAMTVTFDLPERLAEVFAYQPGQHLNIRFLIDGTEARRSYSLNSCPYLNEPLQVTVKRVEGGLVSNYVNDALRVGDELDVMPPTGKFVADLQPKHYKHYFLFGAGSGITPLLSILRSILYKEPYSFVHLFYGNRNKAQILFYDQLKPLQEQYPNRLGVVHTLSSPYSDWSSIWGWDGRTGRIDQEAVEWFIATHPPKAQSTEYFICGPGTMNQTVRQTLLGLGVPKTLIHVEHFGADVDETQQPVEPVADAQLIAHLDGRRVAEKIPKGQTVLQVLKENAHDPPYSCESGVCSTCVAKVLNGTVHMKACMALDEAAIERGYVLTCQALPMSPEVEITFDA